MALTDVIKDQPTAVTGAATTTLNLVALVAHVPADVLAAANASIGAWLLVLHVALLPARRRRRVAATLADFDAAKRPGED